MFSMDEFCSKEQGKSFLMAESAAKGEDSARRLVLQTQNTFFAIKDALERNGKLRESCLGEPEPQYLTGDRKIDAEIRERLGRLFIERTDIGAATIMRKLGIALAKNKSIIGHILGVPIGEQFRYREEMQVLGLHPLTQPGVGCAELKGVTTATAVIVSGGYEDNQDWGDELLYSGQGGHTYNTSTIRQQQDQQATKANRALIKAQEMGNAVRVIRMHKSPKTGSTYTYDGVYRVTKVKREKGVSGHLIFHFRLVRDPGQAPYRCPLTATRALETCSCGLQWGAPKLPTPPADKKVMDAPVTPPRGMSMKVDTPPQIELMKLTKSKSAPVGGKRTFEEREDPHSARGTHGRPDWTSLKEMSQDQDRFMGASRGAVTTRDTSGHREQPSITIPPGLIRLGPPSRGTCTPTSRGGTSSLMKRLKQSASQVVAMRQMGVNTGQHAP